MDFVVVVDQAIALLRQRGRVTYRTLKRQFQLDDEALEDLKVELIEGQRLATDEQGTVLVWTGDAEAAPASARTLVQRQHEFDGFLHQRPLPPLPLGEGRDEGPQRLVKAPHPNPLPGGEGTEEDSPCNCIEQSCWSGSSGYP